MLISKNDFDPAFKPVWYIFLVTWMQVPVLVLVWLETITFQYKKATPVKARSRYLHYQL